MLKLGIMGLGNIAHAMAHASIYETRIQLYAVASRDIKKALLFKEQYGCDVAYGSYGDLIKDEKVDLIYIATPHGLHHKHIKLCLEHHKHVLCEKAFTLNETLASPLFEHAKKKNLFMMEAMWTRFLPSTEKLIEIIQSNQLGRIKEVSIDFGFIGSYHESHRLFNKELGGGALLDIGVYALFMSYVLFGKSHAFKTDVQMSDTSVDIDETITLDYDTFQVHIQLSFTKDLKPNALRIIGEKETLISENFWMSEKILLLNSKESHAYPFEYSGYAYELKACVDMIELNQIEHPKWRHQDTLEILKWMDEIRDTWGLKYPVET
jgi:predicted dehydrogenase